MTTNWLDLTVSQRSVVGGVREKRREMMPVAMVRFSARKKTHPIMMTMRVRGQAMKRGRVGTFPVDARRFQRWLMASAQPW